MCIVLSPSTMLGANTCRNFANTCRHLPGKFLTPVDTYQTFFVHCVVCICACVYFPLSLHFVGCIVSQAL